MIKNILKWQGGKSSLLLNIIGPRFPLEMKDPASDITFIDAFAGGGSVFLYVLQNCPGVKRLVINDYNKHLINLYYCIKNDFQNLLINLDLIQTQYNSSPNKEGFYNDVKNQFNYFVTSPSDMAAKLMFLNRVGFNGIYRENGLGLYNVPWSKKETVSIYSMESLSEANRLLNSLDKVVLCCGDFQKTGYFVTQNNTFVYFDPPYRPLSITSGFTSYTKEDFNDENQKELADFYKELDLKNAKLMLSNSNPKNTNKEDNFFEDIYKGFNINEVSAKRMINSKAQGRGEISELLITNYKENNECIQENSILKMVVSN